MTVGVRRRNRERAAFVVSAPVATRFKEAQKAI
jgi:hypothetical protein